MKIEEVNILIEKAKSKDDGIYSYKGNKYAVKKHMLILYSEGQYIYQHVGYVATQIAKVERYDVGNTMKTLLRTI